MAKLTVSLVTPERHVVGAEVDQVTASSVLGQMGVLPGHRALLAELKEGAVALIRGPEVDYYAVSGGYIEVQDDSVLLLAQTAEFSGDIDRSRSEAALSDAEKKLQKLPASDPQYAEEQARVRRARARLEVVSLAAH